MYHLQSNEEYTDMRNYIVHVLEGYAESVTLL